MIQTLGAATLGALWLPLLAWTVIVAVVLAALRVWRSGHALVQYAARLSLLAALPLGLLLAAVVDFSLLAWLLPAEAPVPAAAFPPPPAVPIPPESAPAFSWGLLHTLGLLTLLAGPVALWQASRLLGHAAALARFARRLPNACSAVQPMVDRQATALGLRRAVRAVVAPDDVAPMTFGWRQPILVLPASLLEDEEQVRLTLLHELVHIRRHDFLLRWVEQGIGVIFAAHPLVWLLCRSIARYRELACDAEVLVQPRIDARQYAALLYRFAVPRPARRPLVLSMATSECQLKKRILAMKEHADATPRWLKPKHVALALAVLLLGMATFVVACTDLAGSGDEAAREASNQEVFVVVEQMPELVDGLAAIQQELRYPEVARLAGIEGRVIIQFVVDEAGRVVDPKVVRGIGGGCDEEAVRALKTVTFKPGMQRGEPVKVKMSIPITFKLAAESGTPDRDG